MSRRGWKSALWIGIGLFAGRPVLAQIEVPTLVAGPMVGHVGEDVAHIWVQGDRLGWMGLEYKVRPLSPAKAEEEPSWQRVQNAAGRPLRLYLPPERKFTGVFYLQDLAPNTSYEYRILNQDGAMKAATEQSFQTAPLRGSKVDFQIGFGSCAGDWGDDPSQRIFKKISERRPRLFLWLGDNIYFSLRDREWADPEAMWNRYGTQRALENLQPLLRRTHHYAIWDDHDYGPDNSDKLYVHRNQSLQMFASFWANPAYGSDGQPGVWFSFSYGDVDFFLLDTRYFRDPARMPDGPEKSLLGTTQRNWLYRSLKESRATFKILVSATQVLATYHDFESWNQYPHERDRLFDFIATEEITGLMILSGDRHSGEILKRQVVGISYPFYEFTASPLAAGIGSPAGDAVAKERLPGSSITQEHFGWLDFQMNRDHPRVVYAPYDVDGSALRKPYYLEASELR